MNKFLEAFVYFVESGLPEKLAKQLAESLTGVKAPTGKIEIPKTKGPDVFQTPKAKDDVIEASDNVSPSYAAGDTKYNADVLAEELARKRGFIKDDGIQDATDMSQTEYSKLYSEAYQFLTELNRLNKPVKRTPNVKKLATKKERGDLTFVNTKISNPLKSKMVLQGLDGTTDGAYSQFRIEQNAIKKGLEKDLKYIKDNNIALGQKDKDNILYNIKIYNDLTNKVDSLSDEIIDAGKEPEKVYNTYVKTKINKLGDDPDLPSQMEESITKIQKLLKEMEDIKSGKTMDDQKNLAKKKYQGKGYGPNEGIFRTLTRQFLADEIEAGRIETTPAIYNAMREGGHPFIDAIKVFRHHYGDDKFNNLSAYIDATYDFNKGSMYPGRFQFRKLGLVPKNKKAPGKSYAHYSTPSEIDAEIQSIDNLISDYQQGKSPMIRTKQELLEGIREQNKRRAQFVKIRNEIAPEDAKQLPGDELLETAEVVPIKEEGILTGVDNTAKKLEKLKGKDFKGVELYGDETFDELKYIDENGVHPRDLDPREGFAGGGIVEVLI
jgi:hypothetical protein